MGANELRIVRRIEDSIRDSKGPRIHVIKSRDIANSRNFAEKVFRVLKMHGYSIEPLTAKNLDDSVDTEPPSTRIYAIDEDTIKDYLGERINETTSPVQYIFDKTKLAYIRKPVLVSVVSDSFYEKYGVAKDTEQVEGKPVRNRTKKATRKNVVNSKLAIYSFYIAAASFFISGLNAIIGSYLTFSISDVVYSILPLAILLFSIAAIAVRAFSLAHEDKKSVIPVTLSIVLFIFLLVIGIALTAYDTSIADVFYDTGQVLFSSSASMIMVALAFVVMVIAMSRYILFLGTNSGSRAYFLAMAGILLLIGVVLVSNFPPMTIFGSYPGSNFAISSQPTAHSPIYLMMNFFFDPEFPLFGGTSFFSSNAPQYLLVRNYILLLANTILGLSYVIAARTRR